MDKPSSGFSPTVANPAVNLTAKNGGYPGDGKIEEIQFSLGRWVPMDKKCT